MHLIVSHAASHRWPVTALDGPELPHLRQLLGRMRRVQVLSDDDGERPHPLTPPERTLAQTLKWPENGPWPWAARDTGSAEAQAWITPCHWQMGMDRAIMLPPEVLQLGDEESRQLLQAMQPFFVEDGLQVQWQSALRWLAQGEVLQDIASASLARVAGVDISPWITDGTLPPRLRRLQSEMQMLLYHHPINDARLARGLPSVNSFWIHGAGHLDTPAAPADVHIEHTLEARALQGDAAQWQNAWQQLDSERLGPICRSGEPLTLTLCSETAAHTWCTVPLRWTERLQRLWAPPHPGTVLRALLSDPEHHATSDT